MAQITALQPALQQPTKRLLAMAPDSELQTPRPAPKDAALEFKQDLYAQDRPAEFVWFVRCGVVWLRTEPADGLPVEVATVGPEGFTSVQILLDDATMGTHRAFVQVPGEAARIAASLLMRAGLIRYIRGRITTTDRAGLEAASCDCYRVITEQFERLGSSNT